MTLPSAQELRAAGKHEQARELLVSLARRFPVDAVVQYEAACVHDFLGLEAEAVPFYLAALAGELPLPLRRSAFTGLGSTYRTLGSFHPGSTPSASFALSFACATNQINNLQQESQIV